MKKVCFLYNPSSGENLIPSLMDEIVAVHQRCGYALLPYRLTFAPDQQQQILALLEDDFHHLLMAGGDGTVNYVVNLLKNNDIDIPVAVLPAGTANDFANLLGLPTDPVKACEKILSGQMRRIDLGKVNGQWFANVFSCGLFTDVSQKTPTIFKNTFGKLAYYISGLGELPKFRRMHLEIRTDGGDYVGSSLLFFVFNGRTAGNMRIAYLSEVDDGLLDVLIIKGDNPAETLQTIFHYTLRNSGEYPPGVVHLRCSKLTAHCAEPETTDIDGQAGPGFPLEIDCMAGSLTVLAPKQKTRKKSE